MTRGCEALHPGSDHLQNLPSAVARWRLDAYVRSEAHDRTVKSEGVTVIDDPLP